MTLDSRQFAISASAVTAIAVLSLIVAWTGYNGTDDRIYLQAAEEWVVSGPHLAHNHWSLRFALVLPLAAVQYLFGPSEFANVAVATAHYLGIIAVTFWIIGRCFDYRTAGWVAAILASTPLYAVHGTIVFVDIVEMFYCVASLALFIYALDRPQKLWPLIFSGICAGMAWESRLTAGVLGLVYGVLFLMPRIMDRKYYFLIGLGFLIVVSIESLAYMLAGESPLYRIVSMTSSHGSFSQVVNRMEFGHGTGNVAHGRWIAPIGSLLVNQEFGFLFYLAVPAAIMVFRGTEKQSPARTVAVILLVASAVWFLVVGYSGMVRPWPRYFHLAAYGAVVLVGIWVARQQGRAGSRYLAIAAVLLMASNLAIIAFVENKDNRFAERLLTERLIASIDVFYTDPRSFSLSLPLLEWNGPEAIQRLKTEPPVSGSLFFYNPVAVDYGRAAGHGVFDKEAYRPHDDWTVVWEYQKPPRYLYQLIELLGLIDKVPEGIRNKLSYPKVTLYRVP